MYKIQNGCWKSDFKIKKIRYSLLDNFAKMMVLKSSSIQVNLIFLEEIFLHI